MWLIYKSDLEIIVPLNSIFDMKIVPPLGIFGFFFLFFGFLAILGVRPSSWVRSRLLLLLVASELVRVRERDKERDRPRPTFQAFFEIFWPTRFWPRKVAFFSQVDLHHGRKEPLLACCSRVGGSGKKKRKKNKKKVVFLISLFFVLLSEFPGNISFPIKPQE